eukprot:scaffold101887_cov62-Cyclotella_meneghiniana.AAC.1
MSIKYAFPTLLLLIAANFAAFTLHVWYLLPDANGATVNVGTIDQKNSHLRDDTTKGKSEAAPQRRTVKKQQTASRSNKEKNEPIRYDVVASLLQNSYGRVHQLLSIPAKRRMVAGTYNNSYTIPSDAVSNLTYFLESRLRENEEERPLYLYNPSLLPLTSNMHMDVDVGVSYIATYRVSNFGNCHGFGRGVPDTYRNYLGVALLDHELNILKDEKNVYYEAVIDLNAQLLSKGKKAQQSLQDCQIYTASTSNGVNGEDNILMLQCNEYVMPIKLQVMDHTVDEDLSNTGNQETILHNTYGTKLQLMVLQKPHMIVRHGKNMHYFGPGYIETWPSGPHEYIHMDFSKHPYVTSSPIKSSGIEPESSFTTPESNLIDRDSGSACCVPIQLTSTANGGDSTTRQLLLGFSHRKTKKVPKKDSYNYVSRVYAFEPTPPFNIVAQSGFFCLGFASADKEAADSENEQLRGSANGYKLTIQKHVYDCPRIHFITGITEKIDDKETVIVSYGVNDCYPRMVEIKKDFLISLLKGAF